MQRQPWSQREEPPFAPQRANPTALRPAIGFWQPPACTGLVTTDPLPGPTHGSVWLRVLLGIGSPTFTCTTRLQLKAQNVSGWP